MNHQLRTYGTKTILIQAYQLTRGNFEAVSVWCNGEIEADAIVCVDTLDGPSIADQGDYILRYPTGEFSVISKEQFNLLFDLTDSEKQRDGDMWPEVKDGVKK